MRNHARLGFPLSKGILWLTGVHLSVAAATIAAWSLTGDTAWIDAFFRNQGALFFVLCALLEFSLAVACGLRFLPGEPLRLAWLMLAVAAGYRLLGFLSSQILAARSALNPLIYLGWGDEALLAACRRFGVFLTGPPHMIVLAVGLFVVLRTYRRLGLLSPLKKLDLLLIACVSGFMIRQLYEIAMWLRQPGAAPDIHKVLSWASDPLLCLLLFEAVLLRRAVVDMGDGLVSRCWGAVAVGVVFTALGDVGIWAESHGYLAWPWNSITWYVWFPASAAYAVAPAFQLEACRYALRQWMEPAPSHRT